MIPFEITLNIRTEADLMIAHVRAVTVYYKQHYLLAEQECFCRFKIDHKYAGYINAYTDLSGFRALFSCPAGLEFVQLKPREHMRFCVENDLRERERIPGGEKKI